MIILTHSVNKTEVDKVPDILIQGKVTINEGVSLTTSVATGTAFLIPTHNYKDQWSPSSVPVLLI